MKALPLLLATALAAPSLWAQDEFEIITNPGGVEAQSGPTCTGGVSADDGSPEMGYRLGSANARVVQRLTPPSYPSTLTRACTCWLTGSDPASTSFNFVIYDDNGPGGAPGTLLGSVASSVSIGTGGTSSFIGRDCTALGLQFTSGSAYVGVQWNGTNEDIFTCLDFGPSTPANAIYQSGDGVNWQALSASVPGVRALFSRAEFTPTGSPDPTPPPGPWLTTTALPGFQFKARFDGNRNATKVNDCVPETLCLAGAIPNRTEVFTRIIGPRPNGFLWVETIRFTVAQVEFWVQKTTGGPINYYQLAGVPQDSDVLNGLVDRQAFLP